MNKTVVSIFKFLTLMVFWSATLSLSIFCGYLALYVVPVQMTSLNQAGQQFTEANRNHVLICTGAVGSFLISFVFAIMLFCSFDSFVEYDDEDDEYYEPGI